MANFRCTKYCYKVEWGRPNYITQHKRDAENLLTSQDEAWPVKLTVITKMLQNKRFREQWHFFIPKIIEVNSHHQDRHTVSLDIDYDNCSRFCPSIRCKPRSEKIPQSSRSTHSICLQPHLVYHNLPCTMTWLASCIHSEQKCEK